MLIHEIRTPLSVIRLSLDRPSMAPERYRDIDEALRDMDAFIERCSLAEQVDAERLPVHAEWLDVAEVLREAAVRHAPAESLALDADGASTIESDRHMLNVIVSNLIDNAMKYSPRGSSVAVSARAAERRGEPGVLIAVANAVGRAGAPDPDQVFEKFYRAPGARAKVGSGLGLYIVRGLADLLGGTVECIVDGEQVRFELWLPGRYRPALPAAQPDSRTGAAEDRRPSLFGECLP
jgi:signal transduction histidine kinase